VSNKFHLFKKLSEAIDRTGGRNGLLKGKKYNVLKNRENRTEAQQKRFEEMVKANLLTAKAWQIRENFKYLFAIRKDVEAHYQMWKDHAISQSIQAWTRLSRHLTTI